MPKKTDRKVLLRIFQLLPLSLTLQEIADRLSQEFEEIPDISTISRHVKKFREEYPDELKEDAPFSWSTMTEVPWSDSHLVLALWADYQDRGMDQATGPFSRRLAKWSWRVLKAVGASGATLDVGYGSRSDEATQQDTAVEVVDLNSPDIWYAALEYAYRETASIVLGEAFDTRDLDMWLAFAPWKGEHWMIRYQELKYGPESKRAGLDTPIHWHFLDIDWMEKVDPFIAMNLRKILPEKKPRRSMSPGEDILRQTWTQLADGLLTSQIAHWLEYREQHAKAEIPEPDSRSRPWYIKYMERVVALGDLSAHSVQNTENAE